RRGTTPRGTGIALMMSKSGSPSRSRHSMRVLSPSHKPKSLRDLRTGAALLALTAALLGVSSCSSVDPATRLTRELLSMPKEEASAKGEALIARKKYELGRQYLRFVAENYANDPIGK